VSQALTQVGEFDGRITIQPITNSTTTAGNNIAATTAQPYFKYYINNTKTDVEFAEGTNKVTLASHGFDLNQEIVFSHVDLTGGDDAGETNGVTIGDTYFVINLDGANRFQLATSASGSAISISNGTTTGQLENVTTSGYAGLTGSEGTATDNAVFSFSATDQLREEFIALLATKVFGSSEADYFSNKAAIEASYNTATETTATDNLNLRTRTEGVSASTELVDAMHLPSHESHHRYSLPYNATSDIGIITTANDLVVADQSCTFNVATDLVTTPAAHGLSANNKVYFPTTSSTLGIDTNLVYYVRGTNLTATDFELSDERFITYVTNDSGDRFELNAHGHAINDTITFSTTTSTGFNTGTTYYVRGENRTDNVFHIAASFSDCTIDAGLNLFTLTGHGFAANDIINFATITTTSGFFIDTDYYAIPVDADTFKIAASSDGDVIVLTDNGSATIDGDLITLTTDGEATRDGTLLGLTGSNGTGGVSLSHSVTFDDTTNVITRTAHKLLDGDKVKFNHLLDTNLTDDTYFVINKTDDTFQISQTSGGAVWTFTDGTGDIHVTGPKVDIKATPAEPVGADNWIALNTHGYENGDTVHFADIVNTASISVATTYFVVNKTDHNFQVALTAGGTALTLGVSGTGSVLIIETVEISTEQVSFSGSTDMVTIATGHGYVTDEVVIFTDVNLTTAISKDLAYYVRDVEATTFKLAAKHGGTAFALTTDGNGIISKTGLGHAKTHNRTVIGLDSSSVAATLTIALNSVQGAVLNGRLNNSGDPTEVPLEVDDIIRVLYTITSSGAQQDSSDDSVTATQTFFVDFTLID